MVELTKDKEAPSQIEASAQIDRRIEALRDWRGRTLALVRAAILGADPEIVEEWKWRGVPVWSHGGILCTGETYKSIVKLTFARGASLLDPAGLFNSSLEGNVRRAIDLHEGDTLEETAFQELVLAAVAFNLSAKSQPKPGSSKGTKAGTQARFHPGLVK